MKQQMDLISIPVCYFYLTTLHSEFDVSSQRDWYLNIELAMNQWCKLSTIEVKQVMMYQELIPNLDWQTETW